ncbi:hypothetical protein MRB53_022627 [Persea americana]|uniref:Uncharacterized protein n=1 Tax=Persea americana TaxID=3435 RepID=A0ACC2L782_PERAE|nr:hypothetical protein MRB53_022627 [Persea americana]
MLVMGQEAEDGGGSTADVSKGGIEDGERLAKLTEVDDGDYPAEDAGASALANKGWGVLEVLSGVKGDVAEGSVKDGGGGVGDEEDGSGAFG